MALRSKVLAWMWALQAVCVPAAAWAVPVSYDYQGVLTLGAVGGAAGDLASRLSPAAFGAFSISLTYDADTLQFRENVYLATGTGPVLIGRVYDVAGSTTVTLANGTTMISGGLQETVWNELAPWGSSFDVGAGLAIPATMWSGAPPPDCRATPSPVCWLPMLSYLNFGTGSAWPADASPPRDLGSATTASIGGSIRGDFNHDGVVDLGSETIELIGGATRVTAVPEPSVFVLMALALPLLLARSRRARDRARGPAGCRGRFRPVRVP